MARFPLGPVLALGLLAAPVFAGPLHSKLDARARRALVLMRATPPQSDLHRVGVFSDDALTLDVFVTGDVSPAELEAAGARVRTRLPGLCTAYVPAGIVDRITALAGVRGVWGSVPLRQQLNLSVPAIGTTPLRGPGPGFTGLNGAGVLVGAVDSGVDYDHADFRKADGTTRLVGIWDQTDGSGSPPASFGYGSEWNPAQINAHVASQVDLDGHGTHVLGIAAGDGSATGGGVPAYTYAGVAPQADLVAVKTDLSSAGVVDGVNYIMDRAAALGKNAVVNLSVGTLYGPKDGTSPFESAINALCGLGRIVVVSAGNEGGTPVHAEVVVPPAGIAAATIEVLTSSAGGFIALDGYYGAAQTCSVRIRTPDNTVIGPVALGAKNAEFPGQLTANGSIYVENGIALTASGDRQVYVEINVPSPNPTGASLLGTWTLEFIAVPPLAQAPELIQGPAAVPGEVDLWLFSMSESARFAVGADPTHELIDEPGTAPDVITVGAWTTKDSWTDCGGRTVSFLQPETMGAVVSFSSPGPTRDGRQKPDLVGPGLAVGSALTHDIPVICPGGASHYLNDGAQHTIEDGTSVAAPHVAGAVALLLQKFGALTPAGIKAILFSRAIQDGFTGPVWNKDYGNGKLFLGDLTDPSAHVVSPNGGEGLMIGGSTELTWGAADPYQGVTGVDLELTRDNGLSWESIASNLPNTGSIPWTVTGPPTAVARFRVTAHDAAGNVGRDTSDATCSITGAVGVPPAANPGFSLVLATGNPARGAVQIMFEIPRSSAVRVEAFDLQGQLVATLADGPHAPGRYSAAVGGRLNRPGLYFIRLSAPGCTIIRRLVVLR